MIENKNQFGKLSEIELVDFEKENRIALPDGYRDFLWEVNACMQGCTMESIILV